MATLLATQAQEFAAQFPGTNGLDNAIQHAYWSARITHYVSAETSDVSYGASIAEAFTTAHEYTNRYSDGGAALDSVMDLHNNAIGIAIAKFVYGEVLAGRISALNADSEIRSRLIQALEDGQLWIIDGRTFMIRRSNGQRIHQ